MSKRVIIADDHAVVRTGLQLILEETEDLAIVDEATNGAELLSKLEKQSFDLVILDISMPGKDALDVLKEIKNRWEHLPVVIFTMNPDEGYAVRMLRNGASAFINKETNPDQIISVLRTVAGGKKFISQSQMEVMLEMFSGPEKKNSQIHDILTDREFQIMVMLANGLKKSEIAAKLMLSKHTVGNHRNNILKKLNLSTNAELVRFAIHHGVIQ
ncbi:MAG: response regulator transcription factor [Bacteroidales bacterium]|nr:response regulator transcription factor [Bacteroidales bacterium]